MFGFVELLGGNAISIGVLYKRWHNPLTAIDNAKITLLALHCNITVGQTSKDTPTELAFYVHSLAISLGVTSIGWSNRTICVIVAKSTTF
ncbi:hypothetical protein VNO78_22109 [Psophocarpus tetragonolobus]|uniref:Uncharacterized protein n=1 Tax=Psophocarpus tetragonolobus TaxID=3891 RepID=A0AAN9SCQ9_PSOTE